MVWRCCGPSEVAQVSCGQKFASSGYCVLQVGQNFIRYLEVKSLRPHGIPVAGAKSGDLRAQPHPRSTFVPSRCEKHLICCRFAAIKLLSRGLGRRFPGFAHSSKQLGLGLSRVAAFLCLALLPGIGVPACSLLPSLAGIRCHGRVQLAELGCQVN